MKKILIIAAMVAATSCSFIRINDQALSDAIRNGIADGNVIVSTNSGPRVTASRTTVTRSFDLEPFDRIQVDFACDVRYEEGEPSVQVTIPDNLEQYFKADVSGGRLYLRIEGVRLRNSGNSEVIVRTPVLRGIELNGAGDIEMDRGIVSDNLVITVNGAGDIDIDGADISETLKVEVNGAGDIDIDKVECSKLVVAVNGAGDCEVSGHAGFADLSISGVGSINATELVADDMRSSVDGVGKVHRK